MSRPPVSVVVPFAGDRAALLAALDLLDTLATGPGDERILADNAGAVAAVTPEIPAGVTVVPAPGERSPAHARNTGAAAANTDWLLFLDADVRAPADLIDRFFPAGAEPPIPERTGAVTGEIRGVIDRPTLAARYGASRNFLAQRTHLADPFRPRAAAANLLVRRAAFTALEGFAEGVRAGEDTDFAWRLQAAGWRLDYRPEAEVEHRYRESLADLRRQWRGYAAGARWLAARHPGFTPDPAVHRALRLLLHRVGVGPGLTHRAEGQAPAVRAALPRSERARFLFVQCLLAVEELIGHRQDNRAR